MSIFQKKSIGLLEISTIKIQLKELLDWKRLVLRDIPSFGKKQKFNYEKIFLYHIFIIDI